MSQYMTYYGTKYIFVLFWLKLKSIFLTWENDAFKTLHENMANFNCDALLSLSGAASLYPALGFASLDAPPRPEYATSVELFGAI